MLRRIMKGFMVLSMVVMVAGVGWALADIPATINFQGKLSGVADGQNPPITISIIENEDGSGAIIYTLTKNYNEIADPNGFFSVNLVPEDLFVPPPFNKQYYVKVEIAGTVLDADPTSDEIQCQALTASPYARSAQMANMAEMATEATNMFASKTISEFIVKKYEFGPGAPQYFNAPGDLKVTGDLTVTGGKLILDNPISLDPLDPDDNKQNIIGQLDVSGGIAAGTDLDVLPSVGLQTHSSAYGVLGRGKVGIVGLAGNDLNGPSVTNYIGVYGQTGKDLAHSNPGVVGIAGGIDAPTYPDPKLKIGVYGESDSVGVRGQGNTIGVYGGGGIGVYGHSKNGTAVYADGDFVATGAKNALVATENYGQRKLYSMESPGCWFEDFGQGQLVNGETTIKVDPIFAETIDPDAEILVFVQLTSPAKGTYVETNGMRSFTVIELDKGNSDATFTYRVLGKRKGYASKRLEEASELASFKD